MPYQHYRYLYVAPIGMLEVRLSEAKLLTAVLEAIKELTSECNFDCNDSGVALQAMDNSHVALVAMLLCSDGFDPYRCARNLPLGINWTSLNKIVNLYFFARPITITMDIDSMASGGILHLLIIAI